MTDDTATRAQSRPKLIVLDLRSIGTAESLSELSPQECVDTLWTAAIETGLPIVVITGGGDIMPHDMEDVYPPHVTFVDDRKAALASLAAFRRFGPESTRSTRTPQDVFWISDDEGQKNAPEGARHWSIQDAIPKLYQLSNRYRSSVLNGLSPTEGEIVHTILLPLDLDLGSMGDPHLICSHGRFFFDAILLVEGQVAMAGFKVKSLEKLIAGYAPLLYSLDNEFFEGAKELRSALKRLHDCGARDVIGVCNGREDRETHHPFEDYVRNAGLAWHRAKWNDLFSKPGHVS
ncbi:hypothetical protein MUY35_09855 [Aliiroseovarius sp. S1339]|uniref:hypothetical protein n=1 Tax=Aliiroseovarius sp. S1339 TaxID=2936990 RepID=UPI0020BDF3C9|nr:hypothetical protein [Aliiroseovarius sp. S1339]MCK8464154.1 hypothetical protein [Aliiroseovarius sp. S1339]